MPAAWPPASALHVLMIALGDEVLTGWGDVRERHLEYAGRVAHLHMLVYSPRARDLSVTALSPQLTVYPTRSATRIGFIWDAYHIGRAVCCDYPIDLITTQDPFSTGLPGVWLRRRFGIPLHVQNHSSFFDNPYWLAERPLRHAIFNRLGKWVLRRADACRVVNHAERAGYLARGLPADRVSVVPVPARLERFTPEGPPGEGESLRERLDIPPAAPVLLWIGRPAPVKRVPLLLDAFARVRQDYPDAYLLLVGDFSSYPAVPAQVARLGLDRVVRFAGQVEHGELPVYYRLCTVYVHSSAYEGFGLVLVEAASCARPVVATRTAGAQEVVLDGQTGLLCKLEDPADLAAGVIALLDDPTRAAAMGRAGQAYVRQRFDRDRTLQAIIESWRYTASFKGQL